MIITGAGYCCHIAYAYFSAMLFASLALPLFAISLAFAVHTRLRFAFFFTRLRFSICRLYARGCRLIASAIDC